MKTLIGLATGALLPISVGAFAQDAPNPLDPAQMDAPAAEVEAAPTAAETSPGPAVQEFTDAQIAGFAAAALAIRELQDDDTLDEEARRASAEAIVMEHGLDPDTYSAIGMASQSDPAVAQRIQLAITELREGRDS